MQQHGPLKKASRLKRIILSERASKAVAEAERRLVAAEQAAEQAAARFREVSAKLEVRDLHGCSRASCTGGAGLAAGLKAQATEV